MRPIDADKTIGLLKTRLYETALNNATVNCDASYLYTECADNRIKTWIDEIPTIESNRGKWVSRIGNGNIALIECSECHFEYPMLLAHMFRYCPNCGAKMEGSEE